MVQGALVQTLMGPAGHDALAGWIPVEVLQVWVVVHAHWLALGVWAPDPELVLHATL